ncbi:MAG: winged helix-turn-helix domain-containing protein [Burkholderiaceae bacterium]
MVFELGPITLDCPARELRRDGNIVPIEARVFDLLVTLLTHHDRVISKDELIELVWSGRTVSDAAIASCIKAARAAVGDDGKRQAAIKTVHGVGYRFIGHFESTEPNRPSSAPETTSEKPIQARPLPFDRLALFGREADIQRVSEQLTDYRLVSLLGIGGTGKTRLAVASAHATQSRFPEGVWFVDLVPVKDAPGISLAIAETVGLRLISDDPDSELATLIRDRQMLLILDNCEHIRPILAQAVDTLSDRTEAPRFLMTSREPLDLPDECRIYIEPLTVRSDQGTGPALELFQAAAQRLGVPIPDDDLPVAEMVCAHLDGLPLALELAAAQLRQLSLQQLAERLANRFALLAGRARSGRERQASLQAVLKNTWEMLTADEQNLLAQLSMFSAHFSISDIEEMVGDPYEIPATNLFGDLIDKSLAKKEGSRWRLLETVRLFAQQQLTDSEQRALADAHVQWCLKRVGDNAQDHLYSWPLANWCATHYNDLEAAQDHLTASEMHDEAASLAVAASLALHRDNGSRASHALRRAGSYLELIKDAQLIARLHIMAGLCAMAARDPAKLKHHGLAAVETARRSSDKSLEAIALVIASWSTFARDPEAALAQTREATRLATEANDDAARDISESYSAWHLGMLRRYDEALEVAKQVVGRTSDGPMSRDYPARSASALVATVSATSNPEEANRVMEAGFDHGGEFQMWSFILLFAYTRASAKRFEPAVETCLELANNLARAGINSLPDLLIPAARIAERMGEKDRALRWLRAVKEADLPTQSFIMALAYRRLAELIGLAKDDPLQHSSLSDVGGEALQWLNQLATKFSAEKEQVGNDLA